MAKSVILQDTSTNEQIYPLTLLDNVLSPDGTSTLSGLVNSVINLINLINLELATLRSLSIATPSTNGTGGLNGLMSALDKEKLDNFSYSNVGYIVSTQSTSGAVTIDGSIPLHVITCTGNISSVALSTNPTAGHSCHVIFTATAARTVSIAHDSTNRVCPEAKAVTLNITANGYVEVDFLNVNNKIYVRGV